MKKALDFEEELDEANLAGQNSYEALSGAVFFFHADNCYSLNQYKLSENECAFQEVKNFGKISHQNVIRSISLSSDDAMTVSCSVDSVKLWSNESRFSIVKNFEIEGVMSSKFLPGDRYIVLGTKSGSLVLVDISTGQ